MLKLAGELGRILLETEINREHPFLLITFIMVIYLLLTCNASYTTVIRIVDISKIPNVEAQALLLLTAYKI